MKEKMAIISIKDHIGLLPEEVPHFKDQCQW